MARYIDADKFIEELKELQQVHSPSMSKIANEAIDLGLSLAMRTARKSPTADVVEVKHGEWILTKTEFGWNCCEYPVEYTCSVCGRTEKYEEPYCHCGAKMDGGKA